MWRIYSGDKNGVRMRSTPAKLLESLPGSAQGKAFVGRVRYLPEKPLMRFANDALAPGHLKLASNAARTLLVKRPAFEHEREVRALQELPRLEREERHRQPECEQRPDNRDAGDRARGCDCPRGGGGAER